MKKLLSAFLSIILVILSLQTDILYAAAVTDTASIDIWDGLNSAVGEGKFYQGDGTQSNPYIITNGDQLYKMVADMGKVSGVAAYYKLANDIYLNDISNYNNWGKAGFDMTGLNNWAEYQDFFCNRNFAGNFNGDGYTIYGLYAYGHLSASFFPNVTFGAVVRNVNFKYSYVVNTSGVNADDRESLGDTAPQKMWYQGAYGSAGVVFSRCDNGGDGDHSTVDYTIKNCSVIDAYVEAKYFTSAFVAAANACQPYVANCMAAGITLNSTSETQGVEGAILNMPYGSSTPTALMENVIAVGQPIYGAGRDEMWGGYKTPTISHTYTFTNVYSTVSNIYTINHSSNGNLSFTDKEVTVVDASKLIGAQAESTIPAFDWAYTWRAVEGGYPVPMREYVVPSGKDYYENGGPKYTTDMWDGKASNHFAAGDGSFEDPYLIANCEEFYRMVTMPETDKFYKIVDGVTDLYFNDIEGKSYNTLMTYFGFGIGNNYANNNDITFNGSFDGNGVVLHGIRAAGNNHAALFTKLGNATLKNFTVRYSYFKTSASTAQGAAAIAAEVCENSVVQLKNIAVIDSKVEGKTAAAGFVGNVKNGAKVYVVNSIVSGGSIASKGQPAYQAAFVADGADCSITVKNSISLGIYPASNSTVSYNARYANVYTDTSASSNTAIGINVVDNSALKGQTAKTTCAEFDWQNAWSVTDGVPMPRNQSFGNGTTGSTWSGEIAFAYAGGKGTKASPYQINTAEMLARMLVYGNSGEYYILTADIYINDINASNWKNSAIEWFTSKDVSAFEGCLDGNGYTVYGLYSSVKSQYEHCALIPVAGTSAQIKKLKVDNAYLTGTKDTYLGAIVGIVEDNASVMANINACVVGDNVEFDGDANVGGIVANVGYSRLLIENCVFKGNINTTGTAYGIVSNVIGELKVYDSIVVNATPFDTSDKVDAKNVYTDKQSYQSGVITLTADKMLGANAKTYMSALDFNTLWKTVTNGISEPTGNTKAYNGVKGEIWSGKIASSFAKGNGTQTNPYVIETGEQLALLITKANSYSKKYFKLGCDIYLNNVSDELWQNKSGAQNWISNHDAGNFSGYFDGDGYVVFGMYYNNFKSTPSNTYMGLFPQISGSAEVKNVGISQAYIKATKNDSSVYAGGIFGMGSAFYNFYANKTTPDETVGDVFLIPGQTTPTKLPSFTNCFVDHTCYIEGANVGGIGCAGSAAIVIRDCYVTASLVGEKDTREGGLLGPNWANCSRVYNSFALPQTDNKVIGGNHQWVETATSICTYTENVYYYGSKHIFGTVRIKRPQWRVGDMAKTTMSELDWENTWRIELDGTPVLRVFDKEDRGAEIFSDKSFYVPDVKISFDTGVEGIAVDDVLGKPYENVMLPTPQRQGYKFVAWHAYEDLTLVYPYDYFLPRDITLYAEWQEVSITEDFEKYPYTIWDCDSELWNYNTPQSDIGYNVDYVYSGESSIQLMAGSNDVAALLVNYTKTLTTGQCYTISLWAATEKSDTQLQLAIAHKMYPDYMAADKSIEMITTQSQTVGNWTQYTYTFIAQTPWIAIKVLCGDSVYFDDVVITHDGDLLSQIEATSDVMEAEYYGNTVDSVVLSKGVSSVGEFAFAYSEFVTDIFIDDGVTQIGEYAFYNCNRLTDVWFAGSEKDFEKIIIADNNLPLIDAVWHFDSCAIEQPHSYDEDKFVCSQCGYTRISGIIGDIDNDDDVNNGDFALLMQYINGWDVEIVLSAADVNGDNSINNKDSALLMQYINGWDVELKGYSKD